MATRKETAFNPDSAKRRRPRQERAAQTVERIMDTTLDLILKEGYTALTTNRVAKEARVNISSLYQYFPNKYSIALAIYEKAASELAAMIHKTMLDELNTPMEIGLTRILENLITFVESRQGIFFRLEYEVPELRQTAAQLSIGKMATHISHVYVKQHLPGLSDASVRSRFFFTRHMGIAVINGYLTDRPADISRKKLVAELSRIIFDCLISKTSGL